VCRFDKGQAVDGDSCETISTDLVYLVHSYYKYHTTLSSC
jgi:hypothetical protein